MRFVGRGHPAVRATHDKTLEVTTDLDITARATCVVAVGTVVDEPRPMAGPVRLTLRVGELTHAFDALANPGWDPTGGAVIRRSPVRTPGTFATEADATAAELPRELLALLADPSMTVTVDVDALPSPPTVVLVTPGDGPALAAEFAAADLVVAEDTAAARLLGERVTNGPIVVSGRVVVAACDDLPGRTVVDRPPGTRVETYGLPRALAAAAALPAVGSVVLAGAANDPRAVLQRSPAGARIVLPTTTDSVPALLALASAVLGKHLAAVAFDDRPPVTPGPDGLTGRDGVHLALVGATPTTDPAALAMARGLLADGVPTKTVARALATLTGQAQRTAYDTVLGLRDDA